MARRASARCRAVRARTARPDERLRRVERRDRGALPAGAAPLPGRGAESDGETAVRAADVGTSKLSSYQLNTRCANSPEAPKSSYGVRLIWMVEMRGLEPLTLCLQSRCSPS